MSDHEQRIERIKYRAVAANGLPQPRPGELPVFTWGDAYANDVAFLLEHLAELRAKVGPALKAAHAKAVAALTRRDEEREQYQADWPAKAHCNCTQCQESRQKQAQQDVHREGRLEAYQRRQREQTAAYEIASKYSPGGLVTLPTLPEERMRPLTEQEVGLLKAIGNAPVHFTALDTWRDTKLSELGLAKCVDGQTLSITALGRAVLSGQVAGQYVKKNAQGHYELCGKREGIAVTVGNAYGVRDGLITIGPVPPKPREAAQKYLPWANAGGPNECKHGYAAGIPCPDCDEAKARTAAQQAQNDRREAVVTQRIEAAIEKYGPDEDDDDGIDTPIVPPPWEPDPSEEFDLGEAGAKAKAKVPTLSEIIGPAVVTYGGIVLGKGIARPLTAEEMYAAAIEGKPVERLCRAPALHDCSCHVMANNDDVPHADGCARR